MLLKNKTSIITGCNKGIGLSILETFAKMVQIFLLVTEKSNEIVDNCKIYQINLNKNLPSIF